MYYNFPSKTAASLIGISEVEAKNFSKNLENTMVKDRPKFIISIPLMDENPKTDFLDQKLEQV